MSRVVMFSGGIGSWAAASRVEHPATLLFADTLIEDADLYRFLREAADNLSMELIRVADGRTPWQLFNEEGFIGNTRVDLCSRVLKRDLLRRWLRENRDPERTVVYLGIDWTEAHRFERARERWQPWKVEAPLCEPPLLTKADILAELKATGIAAPRLYALGFPHNNCGGACVKAGVSHWVHLLAAMPEVFAEWEKNEAAFRERTGKDVAILRDRRNGRTQALPLSVLRARVEAGWAQATMDWGGCGCAID